MRAKTLQILWHGKEPVYSVDFNSNGTLATCGADKEIKLWEVRNCVLTQVYYLSSHYQPHLRRNTTNRYPSLEASGAWRESLTTPLTFLTPIPCASQQTLMPSCKPNRCRSCVMRRDLQP